MKIIEEIIIQENYTFVKQEMVLELTDWVGDVSSQQVKLCLAKVLNISVNEGDIIIKGYLIKRRALYLIAYLVESTGEFLQKLEKLIRKESRTYFKSISDFEAYGDDFLELEPLFVKHKFQNAYLKSLLVGDRIELPYFDPYANWLQKEILKYNFCSCIDYTGAIGPVKVDVRF
ncbi:hypothetical protein SAMN04489761_0260 [Tenacibaculum sp. MAR_2009_124]|uniref:hypothetical protein n=1 Tax=Tenacibaculum sp. MAR_2009_124 TaxID=1250059 RepID=UPI000894B1E6|nr:hypothetical protein [Tenacibaculum sp. MAR_2009_124]SEB37511.1 hypothetical protein SAMN04489761_0260 [Tenacibaculum sp. MAR_2009_124]